MKIRHRKSNGFFLFCLILSFLLSFICFASYNSPVGSILSNAVNTITSPLQFAGKYTFDLCKGTLDYFSSVKSLSKENKALQSEVERLLALEAQNEILRKQNESLYDFLELKKERSDFKLCDAKIIARTNSNYVSDFIINKGSFHGIEQNMPVIDASGRLIGIVFSVDLQSARCRYITSYDVSVGVYDEMTGNTGVLSGDFGLFSQNKCLIRGLLTQTDISVGDRILTSGVGDIYPTGLLIGTVEKLVSDANTQTVTAVVNPGENFFQTDSIMIITDFARIYE